MKYPPPTVGKFRTVTKLTVRKFRTLLLVNQGRVVCGGMVVGGAAAVWVAEGKECSAAERFARQPGCLLVVWLVGAWSSPAPGLSGRSG